MGSHRTAALFLLGAAAAVLLAGCGGDESGPDPGVPTADAGPADAALDAKPDTAPDAADDGGGCGLPSPDPPWIEEYERATVGKLSGEQPIAPGTSLTERASIAARDATRTFLVAELAALGLTAEIRPYDFGPKGANVVAVLPSTTGSTSQVVAGAHFDGVAAGPAAADNGTGVALVLGLARYLSSIECRDRSVLFAFFDQEELGLIGSHVVAEELGSDGTDVFVVHNFDMVSWDSNDDGAIELWSPSPKLAAEYEAVAMELGVAVMKVDFASSDHKSFLDAGFVATGVSELFVSGDSAPHYHTAQDQYDKVDFAYLARTTRLANTVVAREIAVPAR